MVFAPQLHAYMLPALRNEGMIMMFVIPDVVLFVLNTSILVSQISPYL